MTQEGEDRGEYTYTGSDGVPGRMRAAPGNPSEVAQEFIADWDDSRVVWRGDFYKHVGSHWEKETEADVMKEINSELMYSLYSTFDPNTKKDVIKAWNPTNSSLANLRTQVMLQAALPSNLEPVCGGEFVFLENGRYSISTGVLLPHDKKVFNLHSVPFAYDESAECPQWDALIKTSFGGDDAAIARHYLWMAAELLRAVDLQKAYMLLGETGSGKSTLLSVQDALLGLGQVTGMSIRQFDGGFTLAPLIGKSVCRVNDIRDVNSKVAGAAVEALLAIVGGDQVLVDRKNKDPWVGTLPVMFTLTSNLPPDLPDSSGALLRRLVFNRTVGSRVDSADPGLAGRIISEEMPGVLNRVLEWTDQVYGEWPQTEDSLAMHAGMKRASSPIVAWIEDTDLEVRPGLEITREEAFDMFRSWCMDNGYRPMTSGSFGKHLRAAYPAIGDIRRGGKGEQVRHYMGFGLPSAQG